MQNTINNQVKERKILLIHELKALKRSRYSQQATGFEPQYSEVILLFSHLPWNESKAHPDGVPCPGIKWPGSDTDHSPPSSEEVRNEWSYTSTPP